MFHLFCKFDAVFQVKIGSPFTGSFIIDNRNDQRITEFLPLAAVFHFFILCLFVILPDDSHISEKLHRHIIVKVTFMFDQGNDVDLFFHCAIRIPNIYLFDCIGFIFYSEECSIFAGYILDIFGLNICKQRNICIISQKLTGKSIIFENFPTVYIPCMCFRLVSSVSFSFALCFSAHLSSLYRKRFTDQKIFTSS